MPYSQDGLPFAAGSHTSHLAAVAERARRKEKTARYLRALEAAGTEGLTDWEAHVTTGLQVSSICSIRNACIDCGLVVRCGAVVRVNPTTGHKGTVYVLERWANSSVA